MNNKKEIQEGLKILLLGFIIGVSVAFCIVENNLPSNASNDGWLSFFGGLFGSCISGIVAFYILYINRKDASDTAEKNYNETRKIQAENYKVTIDGQKLQTSIFEYQVYKSVADEVVLLVSELIVLVEERYLKMADNTVQYYEKNVNRGKEICIILDMKLAAFSDKFKVVELSMKYYNVLLLKKINGQVIKSMYNHEAMNCEWQLKIFMKIL